VNDPVQPPIRVVHVLPSLEVGGAETVATRLLAGSDRSRFSHMALTLLGGGELEASLRVAGVPVDAMAPMNSRGLNLRQVLDVAARLRALQPDVVHCWMYHANLVKGFAAQLARRPPSDALRRESSPALPTR
jgi:hypothetical protein